ncbi:MAG: GNAT family N-acetyltransferase [Myxococcota bacterium]
MSSELPELTTDRLRLRAWTLGDVAGAFELYGDPQVTRYIGGQTAKDLDEAREQLEARIAKTRRYPPGYGAWAVWMGDTIVGCGLLKPLPDREGRTTDDIEVGWHVVRPKWGQGIATEVGRRLACYGRDELGLDELHAVTELGNIASMRVAERIGLHYVGRTEAYYGLQLEHYQRSTMAMPCSS